MFVLLFIDSNLDNFDSVYVGFLYFLGSVLSFCYYPKLIVLNTNRFSLVAYGLVVS